MFARSLCAAVLLAVSLPATSRAGIFTSSDVPQGIWDYHTTTSTVTVPAMTVSDVNVIITTLYHTWMHDLRIWITSPQNTSVFLFWQYDGGGDNMINTTFDDSASTHISAGWPPYGAVTFPTCPFRPSSGRTPAAFGRCPSPTMWGGTAAASKLGRWKLTARRSPSRPRRCWSPPGWRPPLCCAAGERFEARAAISSFPKGPDRELGKPTPRALSLTATACGRRLRYPWG
jgi:hypothetical protein